MAQKTVYRFTVDNFDFSFDQICLKETTEFVIRSGLALVDTKSLYSSLVRRSNDGLILKQAFNHWLIDWLSNKTTDDDAMVLMALFDSFDRTGASAVDVVELASGLSVLCKG